MNDLNGRFNPYFSRGQALSESCILLGLFSLLFIGIQVTGSTQILVVDTLLNSLKHAFEISLGKSFHSVGNHGISTLDNHQDLSLTERTLLLELSMAHPGLIRFSVSAQPSNNYVTSVSRSTFVDAGYGYSKSDRHVQQKIAASNLLWSDAFHLSSKEMTEIHKHTARVDHAWMRPLLNIDFLQPWAGATPDQANKRNHAWND